MANYLQDAQSHKLQTKHQWSGLHSAGFYIDGHECSNVVEYRKLYLHKLEVFESAHANINGSITLIIGCDSDSDSDSKMNMFMTGCNSSRFRVTMILPSGIKQSHLRTLFGYSWPLQQMTNKINSAKVLLVIIT